MRAQSNLALKVLITTKDIDRILELRHIHEAQKNRFDMAKNALLEAEQSIVDLIQSGAAIECRHEVQIKTVERRNVAWKSICVELAGAEVTEGLLATAPFSISYRPLVKEAA